MPLANGTRLGPYEILSPLGAGGMGEVYRAMDSKLGREVAIKVLPESFAQDPGRMTRFSREAQVLASLNHPNIAQIYGVEERAFVMELAEGLTLAERIARGPMPLEEALPVIKQVAEALEYAHDRGVIHRDLKPANIKVTPEGRVKVLDFGLAAVMARASAFEPRDPAVSPTITMQATLAGTIMGTAAYMSPEQARGQSVDRGADIWAFGVVLYEMLAGRPLFAGPTISDTLAAVLNREPDLAAIPAQLRPVIDRCLRKDTRRRWRDIGDVRVALEEGVTAAPPAAPARHVAMPWIAAAVVLATIALVGWLVAWRAARPVDHPLTRLSVDLGPEAMMGLNTTVVVSPDGRRLVYPARGPNGQQRLATRLLDHLEATPLPGTENARDPFFSPDGQWIGFFAANQLKKISIQGGAPVTLCPAASPQGASWGEDGNIVAALNSFSGLSRVPAAGGTPQRLTKLAVGAVTHRWPQVLPGGQAVLFTASHSPIAQENANIEVMSLKTGRIKTLQRGGYFGRYLPSGHLVYVHQGVLFGVALDPVRLEVRGTPIPLLEDVGANATLGGGQFEFYGEPSGPGTLVYLAGKGAAQRWQVAWLDSSGKMQPLIATPRAYNLPRFSPDGRRLAISDGSDLYIYDWERDTTSRLTFTANVRTSVWSPDGKHIVFGTLTAGSALFWMRSGGGGEPQRLLESQSDLVAWSFSSDGRRLACHEINPETGYDLWTVPLDTSDPDHPKAGKPEPFLQTPANELVPRFSPDGRWIAYRSDESGTEEIYVRPFPSSAGGKWQISTGGGLYGIWSNNGRELFYETADNRIMVMDYTVNGDAFVPGKPRLWSSTQLFYPGLSNLDLAPDGKRFAVFTMPEATSGEKGSVHVIFLLNFFDELRRRVP